MTLSSGIEPGPHWWEVSALTTAPSLLPTHKESLNKNIDFIYFATVVTIADFIYLFI